jgi:hypothetical protein
MKRSARMILFATLAVVGLGGLIYSQRFDPRFDSFFGFSRAPRNNEPSQTEFVFARLHYTARGQFGGGGQYHDYPNAEEHINQVMNEATILNLDRMSYKIVDLGSDDLFNYPFSYISEAGEMALTEQEVVNLREYINRGGFIMVDDFDGRRSLDVFTSNLRRAFPDRTIYPLSMKDAIFNTFYNLDPRELPSSSDYGPGNDPMFYGFPDGHGGNAMIICHNNDIGEYWEYIDQPRFPLGPSAQSLRFGINFVFYAMSH